MRRKRSLFFIILLCFLSVVGLTISYLQSSEVFSNIFDTASYKTVNTEEFVSPTNWIPGDETPKTITTKNEGTVPIRVRVKFDESWTSSNDEELPLTNNDESVALVNLDNINDWIYKDGYYYYLKELEPGESTTSLLKSVTFNFNYSGDITCTLNAASNTEECISSDDGYMGGTYKLSATIETVHSKWYETVWENVPEEYDYVGSNPCTYNGDLDVGAEYINGQYIYKFRKKVYDVDTWIDTEDVGWGVSIIDSDSTDEVNTPLCTSINNKPVISSSYMFLNSNASSFDLSDFDTSGLKSMRGMFMGISANNIDLSDFDTSNVTDMGGMFFGCELSSLDLSNFDTSNVTDMSHMFRESKIPNLDLSVLDTSNVKNMKYMFYKSDISNLNLDNFDTSSVTDMNSMFRENTIPTLDLSSFDTSNVTDMGVMFHNSSVTSLNLENFDTSNVTDMNWMFAYTKMNDLDLSNFDTSKVTNMRSMFYNCEARTLNLSSFDTSNVTNMDHMFSDTWITTLDISNFDTSKVTIMKSMFSNTTATSIIFGNDFDTSNVTDMSYMFAYSHVPVLDLKFFDTSKVTTMAYMFHTSESTTIDISTFDTTSLRDLTRMFYKAKLTTIDLSSFEVTDVTINLYEMFRNSLLTTGYAKDQANCNRFNNDTIRKPANLVFYVKE